MNHLRTYAELKAAAAVGHKLRALETFTRAELSEWINGISTIYTKNTGNIVSVCMTCLEVYGEKPANGAKITGASHGYCPYHHAIERANLEVRRREREKQKEAMNG